MIKNRNHWTSELRYRRREIAMGITKSKAGFGKKLKRAAHKADRVIGKRLMKEAVE
jgi:hypothetical protein